MHSKSGTRQLPSIVHFQEQSKPSSTVQSNGQSSSAQLVEQAGQVVLLYSAAVQLRAQCGDWVQTLLTLVQTTVALMLQTGTQVVLQVEVLAGIVQVQVGCAVTM